jgi:hypothetical protein
MQNERNNKMPIALEPGEVFKVILESDKSKPKNKQPYFEFRFLSGRQWKEFIQKQAKIKKAKGGIEALDRLLELLAIGLVNWKNMIDPETKKTIKFNIKEMDRLLTMSEAAELLVKFQNQSIDVETIDKKKLDSQSESSTEQSAKPAEV